MAYATRKSPTRTRYLSRDPDSFSTPGCQGSAASAEIASTRRCLMALPSTDWSSFAAEEVISTLYFSTLAEQADQGFEVLGAGWPLQLRGGSVDQSGKEPIP